MRSFTFGLIPLVSHSQPRLGLQLPADRSRTFTVRSVGGPPYRLPPVGEGRSLRAGLSYSIPSLGN